MHSARYGGDDCKSDEDRVTLLLRNLNDVPWERRTARFRCVIALGYPPSLDSTVIGGLDIGKGPTRDTDLACVVGSVSGMIQYRPVGDEGFGYDPVFYLPSFGRTIAQLALNDKNRISHRSDAARRAVAVLHRLAAADTHR